jgi:hypothetical protein
MPKYPASIEQAAPAKKATAVAPLMNNPSKANTANTKTIRIWYSRLRKTIAPSWIAPAISCIKAVPTG